MARGLLAAGPAPGSVRDPASEEQDRVLNQDTPNALLAYTCTGTDRQTDREAERDTSTKRDNEREKEEREIYSQTSGRRVVSRTNEYRRGFQLPSFTEN